MADKYEPKPGDGALFKNKERDKDTQPNATGYLIAHRDIRAGEKVRLAAWTRDGRDNEKFQTLRVSDYKKREDAPPPPADDDDVPF